MTNTRDAYTPAGTIPQNIARAFVARDASRALALLRQHLRDMGYWYDPDSLIGSARAVALLQPGDIAREQAFRRLTWDMRAPGLGIVDARLIREAERLVDAMGRLIERFGRDAV